MYKIFFIYILNIQQKYKSRWKVSRLQQLLISLEESQAPRELEDVKNKYACKTLFLSPSIYAL